MSDYISREALLKRLHEVGGCGAPPDSWADGYDKAIDLACGMVKNAPAADVAPARRGEWIGYACSAYGGIDEYGDVKWIPKKKFLHEECGRWNAIREPFCPNCGAKMGGKQ